MTRTTGLGVECRMPGDRHPRSSGWPTSEIPVILVDLRNIGSSSTSGSPSPSSVRCASRRPVSSAATIRSPLTGERCKTPRGCRPSVRTRTRAPSDIANGIDAHQILQVVDGHLQYTGRSFQRRAGVPSTGQAIGPFQITGIMSSSTNDSVW